MPFWSRKTEQVPDWAEAMGERGLQGFYQLVGAELSRRGLSYKLGDGVALVGDPPTTCGLMNLAQVCQQTPGGEWPALITAHFDNLLNQPDVDALAADFEKVRALIKVRLFPADYSAQLQLVARPLAESVVAALVYDLPQSIATMHSGHPARLGKSADELFELGYANVREQDRPQVDDVDLGPAGKLRVLAGDSFFTSTHALWIDAYLAPPAEHGAL